MNDFNVKCPECGAEIEIAEQLAAPLVEAEREEIARLASAKTKSELDAQIKAAEDALAEKDAKLKSAEQAELAAHKAKEAAEDAKRNVELDVKRQVELERKLIADEAKSEVNAELGAKLKLLEDEKADSELKLRHAQAAEVEALKAKTAAENAKRETELEVARKMDAERSALREATLKEADEINRLKAAEKDQQLNEMRKQIEELRRKGESGSQQRQGEVLELEIIDILQNAFPSDQFERVSKGQSGADIIQTVMGHGGRRSGSILWESKRTKAWSEGWLAKLRGDQTECKADLGALVSMSLPENVQQFDRLGGVWVSSFQSVVPMAMALRQGLIETARARQSLVGAESKKEVVYDYLTGQEFRQRVGSLVEVYVNQREDLDKEKRSITRQWKSREKQLDRMLTSVAGMYGDLQGIIGSSLPQVEGLELDPPKEPAHLKLLDSNRAGDDADESEVELGEGAVQ